MTDINESLFHSIVYYFGLISFSLILFIIFIRVVVFLWVSYVKRSVQWCPNTWAVVTGSTDGIGLEYARQLAEKGYNLLLLSRNQQKLNKVRDELKGRHPDCEVRVLAVDFSRTDIYDKIEAEFKKLSEIHVLVNNVGILSPNESPEYFCRIPEEWVISILNVNIIAGTRLTRMVLPGMEARGRGVVINLSSVTSLNPMPFFSLYTSTKKYIDFMSRALNEEYKGKGITIQSVLPAIVKTNMTHVVGKSEPYVPEARDVVRRALDSVGKLDSTPGVPYHRLIYFMLSSLDVVSNVLGIDLGVKLMYIAAKKLYNKIKVD